jgi:regulator of cell morphogenesis and NO signaling
MKLTTSIYDIVMFFPQAIDVLDRYNLDYYCNGAKSFLQACEEANLDAKSVWEDIQRTTYSPKSVNRSLEEWDPEILTDLILRHYGDLRERLPALKQVIENVYEENKKNPHPRIKNVYTCFNELADAMVLHSNAEEALLLKQIECMDRKQITKIHLAELDHEHRYIGSLIISLRQLTKNYATESFMSPSANLAWIMLQQFDRELTQRLHLENNILFPKLKKLSF